MSGIENSWRLRWPFALIVVGSVAVARAVLVLRWNDQRVWAYNTIAIRFESPYLPPGFVGDRIGAVTDESDGTRMID